MTPKKSTSPPVTVHAHERSSGSFDPARSRGRRTVLDHEGKDILLAALDGGSVDELLGALRQVGYAVRRTRTSAALATEVAAAPPRLIVLKVHQEGEGGLHELRMVRDRCTVPVMIVSSRTSENVIIEGLDAGADDWLAEPVDQYVFIARVRALLRRCLDGSFPTTAFQPLARCSQGDIEIDLDQQRAWKRGHLLALTHTEFRLLAYLMARPGSVVAHEAVMLDLWGFDSPSCRVAVRVALSRLRAKVEDDPARPRYLHTVSGVGLMFHAAAGEPSGQTQPAYSFADDV